MCLMLRKMLMASQMLQCSVLRHKGGGFMICNFWGPRGTGIIGGV